MTLEQPDIENLLDAISIWEEVELVRQLAQWALLQLIEAEAAESIGADRRKWNVDRTTHRNGSRSRTMSTKIGDLDLGIPKLRP